MIKDIVDLGLILLCFYLLGIKREKVSCKAVGVCTLVGNVIITIETHFYDVTDKGNVLETQKLVNT